MDFADEIAVVTGAASGIGRAIALALAGNAAAVFAADRDLDDAEQTAAAHDRITAAFLDLTSGSWISASRDEVARRFGAAAILVNAAGWDVWPVPGDQRAVLAGCRGHHLCRSRAGLPRVPAVDDRGRPQRRHRQSGQRRRPGRRCRGDRLCGCQGRRDRVHQVASPRTGQAPDHRELCVPGAHGYAVVSVAAGEHARCSHPVHPVPAGGAAVRDRRRGLFFASDMARHVTGQMLSVSGRLTMAG